MSKNKVQVAIAGVTYFLITDESEEHLQKAAVTVGDLLQSLSVHIPEAQKAAVLAALQFSSKLIKLEEKQLNQEQEQKKVIEKLVEKIEQESRFLCSSR